MQFTIVMPYWNRPEALKQTLDSYKYDCEIIVVNDGGDPPTDDRVKVLNLPKKEIALNPCVPINVGVKAAKTEIVCLTNPEISHREPIIDEMIGDYKDWSTAACWGKRHNKWHSHTSMNKSATRCAGMELPKEAGFHFFAVFHREFFLEIGGFDERFRNGQGYDDNDILWNVYCNGGNFKAFDHLIVDHNEAPRSIWPARSNKALFEEKWKNSVTNGITN